jgi:hypothetical protein
MVAVYLENAHDISSYTPYFHFNGIDIADLCDEVHDRLGIPSKIKVRMVVYDTRIGTFHRKELKVLPQGVENVYVVLKVENDQ